MGANNDNLKEVLKTNGKNVCGIKVFMGSSTGNMLVDDQKHFLKYLKIVLYLLQHIVKMNKLLKKSCKI